MSIDKKLKKLIADGIDPVYPLFSLTKQEEVDGADISRYRSRMESCKILDILQEEYKVAETLFFKGGKMSSFGYYPKEGIDPYTAFPAIVSLLKGRDPNHIQKESTIALAIYNWYEKEEA